MKNTLASEQDLEIRTYLSVSHPIDPSEVFTLTDMDMSYALASTLVDWDDSKQILSGLASRWDLTDPRTIRFVLSERARWSNGEPITAEEVKQSFERAKHAHGKELKSLFDSVKSITCHGPKTVEFHLLAQNSTPMVLKKLTEPMYGILRVNARDEIDLGVTSGPYFLEKDSKAETILRENDHWINRAPRMAARIVIRQPKEDQDAQTALISDPWPNLIASHSLMSEELLASLRQHHFTLWKRSLDRVLLLTIINGRLKNTDGFELFRFLQKKMDRSLVSRGLVGLTPATQLFPSGTALYSENIDCGESPVVIPASLIGKTLTILITPERVSRELRDNFANAIKAATGVEPKFHEVALSQLSEATKAGDYDFYLGSLGVADPNYEGALSYFFELKPAPIASGAGAQDFAQRTATIRAEKDETKRMADARAMLRDVVCTGHIVPLFHYSTIVIARSEIDLSKVPTTDESVSFSKVRFR